MSDSLWPHRLLPTRLFCPWNFPGKNTGVGCHLLLQGNFWTQGLNWCLFCLLHWQMYPLPLRHLGNLIYYTYCLLFFSSRVPWCVPSPCNSAHWPKVVLSRCCWLAECSAYCLNFPSFLDAPMLTGTENPSCHCLKAECQSVLSTTRTLWTRLMKEKHWKKQNKTKKQHSPILPLVSLGRRPALSGPFLPSLLSSPVLFSFMPWASLLWLLSPLWAFLCLSGKVR